MIDNMVKYCPVCGFVVVELDEALCPNCGEQLEEIKK